MATPWSDLGSSTKPDVRRLDARSGGKRLIQCKNILSPFLGNRKAIRVVSSSFAFVLFCAGGRLPGALDVVQE
jgi:hypothetical protein